MERISNDVILKIHEAIHEPVNYAIFEDGGKRVELPISLNQTHYLRYTRYKSYTFMEQNTFKNSKYANMARKGAKITWGMHNTLPWILVINGNIINRRNGELQTSHIYHGR